jgi:glycosyltransferase involved in cell wall biosynthesis
MTGETPQGVLTELTHPLSHLHLAGAPGMGDPPRPRCSIVIRAYNEEQHIGRLLTGVSQQHFHHHGGDGPSSPDLEVVLVDSGSTDATAAIASSFASRFPVKVVQIQPAEFTFGRSLNRGIQAASADLIVIASAHVYPVYPDWLERLLEPFVDPRIALVYGRQLGGDSSKFSEHQIFARWFPAQSTLRQGTPFCNNANAAIRRSLWQTRPYDETVSGLEDLEWAHWAMGQGYAIAYIAEAEIVHIHNETPRGVYNRYRREAMAFHRIFPNERFGLRHFIRLVLSNIASDLWQAARQGALGRSWTSIFWFRTMQFWGTYQGYRHSGPLTWQLRQTFYYPHDKGCATEPCSLPRPIAPIQYHDPANQK